MGFTTSARRLLLKFVLLLTITGAAMPVLARTVLELDAARQPVALKDWGDAWIDDTQKAVAENVAVNPEIAWSPTREGAIYPLKTGKSLWIRFTVPPAPDAERWYLDIPDSAVNRVTLYSQDSLGFWAAQTAGDTLPVSSWPVPHRHPLMPVGVSAEEPRKYLLRIENPHSFSAPFHFVSEGYLSQHEQRTSLILGIYFGLAGLAVAVGVLSAASLRDNAFGFYALSVGLVALSHAAMTGIGGLHLWPNLPAWNNLSSMVLPVLAVGSLLRFMAEAVSLPTRSRPLHRYVMVVTLLSPGVAAGILLVEPSHRFLLMVPYVVIAIFSGFFAVGWSARRGDRYAMWLLAACLPAALAAAFPLARVSGLIPVSFWTTYGTQLGFAIEIPVLLVILMLRRQQRREHNRRIQNLNSIDPVTGLINGHVFAERLMRIMARAKRLKYQSAVLLIDVVNADQIRRDFGARSAEELPLRVAGRLLKSAREIDTVARLSERRFGMLVEGPLTPEEAACAGSKVVARCLMPFKNKPIEWVAHVRVAQTLIPTEQVNAQEVITRLEAVLAAVPVDSKRAVFSLTC